LSASTPSLPAKLVRIGPSELYTLWAQRRIIYPARFDNRRSLLSIRPAPRPHGLPMTVIESPVLAVLGKRPTSWNKQQPCQQGCVRGKGKGPGNLHHIQADAAVMLFPTSIFFWSLHSSVKSCSNRKPGFGLSRFLSAIGFNPAAREVALF
jgi:hypothetical protein